MSSPTRGRIRVLPGILRDMSSEEPIHVLQVDDEPLIGELVKDSLESKNDAFVVTVESDPTTALDRFSSDPDSFDCIVSDYQMPEMDGLELLSAVREIAPKLPFILFTGKGSEEIASEAISAGVTDYLQKGSGTDRYEVLAKRIENAVSKYRTDGRFRRALQALEWSREGIGLLDEAGRFVYVNFAYADLVNYDRDDLVGMSWEDLYPEGHIEEMREDILPVISEIGRWEGVTTYIDGNGEELLVDHALAYTEDDRLLCMIRELE